MKMVQHWKTSVAGGLSAFMAAVGPISGFLASIQAMQPHPDYRLAIGGAALTTAAAIARLWIGLLQNDAPPNDSVMLNPTPAPPANK